MIRRLTIYFSEQGRPVFVLMLAALTSLAVLGMYEASLGEKALTVGPTLVVAVLTYFLIFLHWRVADEFKDQETDRRFFPHRPVPSGRVKLSDLRTLLIAITVLVFVINAVWRDAFIPFLVVFVYALLMSKWFFLERYLAPNRFMAVLTHSPTFVLLNIYVIAWYAKQQGLPILSVESLVVTSWFVLHVLSWEFARKAWAPSQEMPGYQTYSSTLGHRRAGLLPLVFVILQWLLLAWICARFDLSRWILLMTGIPMLAFAYLCIRYALFPERYATRLNALAPLYLLSIPFVVTLYFAVFSGIRFTATYPAPIYAHIETALWAMFPIVVGGTLHMAVVKDDLFHRLARPIHREWFGSSKTWRGVLAMAIFSIVGVYSLHVLFGPALANATFDFHRLTPTELGSALGLTFILGELPNSFVKRRLGIAPGGRAPRHQFIFMLGDQLDSVIACGLLYVFGLGMPWTTFLVLVPVGVIVLLIVKRALFRLGLKRTPT